VSESRSNAEQIEHWNAIAGPKWVAMQEQLDRQLEPYGRRALEAASPSNGETALDIGCGCGASTLALARAVGPTGSVLGVDISAGMLSRAREVAAARGIGNVSFELTDAQTHPFSRNAFKLAYSRFGIMFFEKPVAAFRNIARALAPRGRIAFVCWQSITKNPWMSLPMMAAMHHVRLEMPSAPDAPGPFAFADRDRVHRILSDAGFRNVDIGEFATDMSVGGGAALDGALDFILRISPVSRSLAEADPQAQRAAIDAIRAAIAPFEKNGVVGMPSAAWIVTARRGDAQ
jgi:ubiquinone/menaquinone biosynthesis C-methylase UbiE